jgi:hypothetical protein
MYARIAEFQSTSKTNCDMMIAFLQNVMLPRNIANGQLSSEVFRINENSGFIVSKFNSKKDADKIMKLMANELNEFKGGTRIKLIEGERVFRLDK